MKYKIIGGQLWLLCPQCGQRLHPIDEDAECHGITTFCRRCGWSGKINIAHENNLQGVDTWQA